MLTRLHIPQLQEIADAEQFSSIIDTINRNFSALDADFKKTLASTEYSIYINLFALIKDYYQADDSDIHTVLDNYKSEYESDWTQYVAIFGGQYTESDYIKIVKYFYDNVYCSLRTSAIKDYTSLAIDDYNNLHAFWVYDVLNAGTSQEKNTIIQNHIKSYGPGRWRIYFNSGSPYGIGSPCYSEPILFADPRFYSSDNTLVSEVDNVPSSLQNISCIFRIIDYGAYEKIANLESLNIKDDGIYWDIDDKDTNISAAGSNNISNSIANISSSESGSQAGDIIIKQGNGGYTFSYVTAVNDGKPSTVDITATPFNDINALRLVQLMASPYLWRQYDSIGPVMRGLEVADGTDEDGTDDSSHLIYADAGAIDATNNTANSLITSGASDTDPNGPHGHRLHKSTNIEGYRTDPASYLLHIGSIQNREALDYYSQHNPAIPGRSVGSDASYIQGSVFNIKGGNVMINAPSCSILNAHLMYDSALYHAGFDSSSNAADSYQYTLAPWYQAPQLIIEGDASAGSINITGSIVDNTGVNATVPTDSNDRQNLAISAPYGVVVTNKLVRNDSTEKGISILMEGGWSNSGVPLANLSNTKKYKFATGLYTAPLALSAYNTYSYTSPTDESIVKDLLYWFLPAHPEFYTEDSSNTDFGSALGDYKVLTLDQFNSATKGVKNYNASWDKLSTPNLKRENVDAFLCTIGEDVPAGRIVADLKSDTVLDNNTQVLSPFNKASWNAYLYFNEVTNTDTRRICTPQYCFTTLLSSGGSDTSQTNSRTSVISIDGIGAGGMYSIQNPETKASFSINALNIFDVFHGGYICPASSMIVASTRNPNKNKKKFLGISTPDFIGISTTNTNIQYTMSENTTYDINVVNGKTTYNYSTQARIMLSGKSLSENTANAFFFTVLNANMVGNYLPIIIKSKWNYFESLDTNSDKMTINTGSYSSSKHQLLCSKFNGFTKTYINSGLYNGYKYATKQSNDNGDTYESIINILSLSEKATEIDEHIKLINAYYLSSGLYYDTDLSKNVKKVTATDAVDSGSADGIIYGVDNEVGGFLCTRIVPLTYSCYYHWDISETSPSMKELANTTWRGLSWWMMNKGFISDENSVPQVIAMSDPYAARFSEADLIYLKRGFVPLINGNTTLAIFDAADCYYDNNNNYYTPIDVSSFNENKSSNIHLFFTNKDQPQIRIYNSINVKHLANDSSKINTVYNALNVAEFEMGDQIDQYKVSDIKILCYDASGSAININNDNTGPMANMPYIYSYDYGKTSVTPMFNGNKGAVLINNLILKNADEIKNLTNSSDSTWYHLEVYTIYGWKAINTQTTKDELTTYYKTYTRTKLSKKQKVYDIYIQITKQKTVDRNSSNFKKIYIHASKTPEFEPGGTYFESQSYTQNNIFKHSPNNVRTTSTIYSDDAIKTANGQILPESFAPGLAIFDNSVSYSSSRYEEILGIMGSVRKDSHSDWSYNSIDELWRKFIQRTYDSSVIIGQVGDDSNDLSGYPWWSGGGNYMCKLDGYRFAAPLTKGDCSSVESDIICGVKGEWITSLPQYSANKSSDVCIIHPYRRGETTMYGMDMTDDNTYYRKYLVSWIQFGISLGAYFGNYVIRKKMQQCVASHFYYETSKYNIFNKYTGITRDNVNTDAIMGTMDEYRYDEFVNFATKCDFSQMTNLIPDVQPSGNTLNIDAV